MFPDHGVDVRQGYGGVLLSDLLRSRTGVEGRDDRVECHSRTSDTDDAVGVGVNRDPFNRFGRVHLKHSSFDYTAAGTCVETAQVLGGLSGQLATCVAVQIVNA